MVFNHLKGIITGKLQWLALKVKLSEYFQMWKKSLVTLHISFGVLFLLPCPNKICHFPFLFFLLFLTECWANLKSPKKMPVLDIFFWHKTAFSITDSKWRLRRLLQCSVPPTLTDFFFSFWRDDWCTATHGWFQLLYNSILIYVKSSDF